MAGNNKKQESTRNPKKSNIGNVFALCAHAGNITRTETLLNFQPLLYNRAKLQEDQLKYCLTSSLVLQCTYEQIN